MVTTTFPSSCTLYTGRGNPPSPIERPPRLKVPYPPVPAVAPDEEFPVGLPCTPSPSVVPLLPICAPLPKAPATRLRAASSAAFRSRSAFSAASFLASSAFSAAVFSGFFASFFFSSALGFMATVSSSSCVSISCSTSSGISGAVSSGITSTSTKEGSAAPHASGTSPIITGTPPSSDCSGNVNPTSIKRAMTTTCTNSAPANPTYFPFFFRSTVSIYDFSCL